MGLLFHFFAITEYRVHDAGLLQVSSHATVSCSQSEYGILLMSCQAIDRVIEGLQSQVVLPHRDLRLFWSKVFFHGNWRWTGGAVVCSRT